MPVLQPPPPKRTAARQEIYRTIADRNAAAAARAIQTHLDRVLRELEVFQERHPNFFTD